VALPLDKKAQILKSTTGSLKELFKKKWIVFPHDNRGRENIWVIGQKGEFKEKPCACPWGQLQVKPAADFLESLLMKE
jgi:hypothetical protein